MNGQLTAIALTLLLAGSTASAQTRIASYAVGEPGTASYEHLSFWVKNGHRAEIYYSYGKDRKEVKLTYAGKLQQPGKPGFKVRFSNGHLLAISPSGIDLQVGPLTGSAPKKFAWEYEGPVDGIGTFCQDCAADEKEALQILRTYYLK